MSSDDGVQPLRAGFPEAELTELRRRVNATRWPERAYPHNPIYYNELDLIYYNELDRGGHFAAWEQPDLFAAEMRASFKSLR
jgi:pimeloyl-ACP methyl ester carboxylesterase